MTVSSGDTLPMEDVLLRVGFAQHAHDGLPRYTIDLGQLELTVSCEVVDWAGRRMYVMHGMYRTEKTMGSIDYKLPLRVETFEQGVAFLAYALRGHEAAAGVHPWLVKGLAWKDHLPLSHRPPKAP